MSDKVRRSWVGSNGGCTCPRMDATSIEQLAADRLDSAG